MASSFTASMEDDGRLGAGGYAGNMFGVVLTEKTDFGRGDWIRTSDPLRPRNPAARFASLSLQLLNTKFLGGHWRHLA